MYLVGSPACESKSSWFIDTIIVNASRANMASNLQMRSLVQLLAYYCTNMSAAIIVGDPLAKIIACTKYILNVYAPLVACSGYWVY